MSRPPPPPGVVAAAEQDYHAALDQLSVLMGRVASLLDDGRRLGSIALRVQPA